MHFCIFRTKHFGPNILKGAIDGKHCLVQNFAKAGTLFRNYKSSFSLVLFAITDSHYKFLFCDVGNPGSANDAFIWNNSTFKERLDAGDLGLPQDENEKVKFHLLGDDIFALSETLMKPYPRSNLEPKQLIFNYRHSYH